MTHLGEVAALGTALCWTFGSMAFEAACKRNGSLPVNMIRLVLGFILLSLFGWIVRGIPLPVDATTHMWGVLFLSGIIGFSIGDLFLFRAFVVIGSRISMLIMASVPIFTTLTGWILMGETLTPLEMGGMFLTVSGICLVILERKEGPGKKKLAHPVKGILLAFGGAAGQAVGLVLSKMGMGDYNAFAATQIRILGGMLGFALIFTFLKSWPRLKTALKNRDGMKFTFIGATLGPFLGVSLSLLAVQHTKAGLAATIMSIVPVLIIPPAIFIFHEKVTLKEVLGAILAVSGVALLFI